MVFKLGQPGGAEPSASESDEVEQFAVRPPTDYVVAFAAGRRSTDSFVVNGYGGPNKSTAVAEDAAASVINEQSWHVAARPWALRRQHEP